MDVFYSGKRVVESGRKLAIDFRNQDETTKAASESKADGRKKDRKIWDRKMTDGEEGPRKTRNKRKARTKRRAQKYGQQR
jgi:hypothetical protein